VEDKKITYDDLESLRKAVKNIVENAKRKPEADILAELSDKGYTVVKSTSIDELLKESEVLTRQAEEKRKEAISKLSSAPKVEQVAFDKLRQYTAGIDKNSEVLKKVRANESLIHKPKA
jgi:hypothetical protein